MLLDAGDHRRRELLWIADERVRRVAQVGGALVETDVDAAAQEPTMAQAIGQVGDGGARLRGAEPVEDPYVGLLEVGLHEGVGHLRLAVDLIEAEGALVENAVDDGLLERACGHDVRGQSGLVTVDLSVHVVAGHEHLLDRPQAVGVEAELGLLAAGGDLAGRIDDAPDVVAPVVDAGEVRVAQQVVELVRVGRAGDDVVGGRARSALGDDVGRALTDLLTQGGVQVRIAAHDVHGHLLVHALGAGQLIDDLLGDVRENPVAHVVQQRGRADDGEIVAGEAELARQHPGDVPDADRVLEARMQRARIDEVRHRELPDRPQALEDGAVDRLPLA